MNNENKNNSNSKLPLGIIGLVLLVVVAGGWWFYQNSKPAAVKSTATAATNANRGRNEASALQAYQSAPPGAAPANVLGSPTATVTVEEFADFQCPTCASVHTKMKEINSIYGSRIKFVYRNFPLTQIHKNAYDASVAAEAAGLQGKFWDMQNQLYANQQAWSNSSEARKLFSEYAQKIGLDTNRFETDSLGLAAKSRVDADVARGRAVGVTGTPAIFINGRQIPFEQFDVAALRRIIDAELQRAPQSSGASSQSSPANTAAPTNSNVAVVVPNNSNAAKTSTSDAPQKK